MTPRLMEILKLIVEEGLVRKEIAWRLRISESTVRFHTRKLFAVYGVHSREQLLRKFGEFKVSVKWVPNSKRKLEAV